MIRIALVSVQVCNRTTERLRPQADLRDEIRFAFVVFPFFFFNYARQPRAGAVSSVLSWMPDLANSVEARATAKASGPRRCPSVFCALARAECQIGQTDCTGRRAQGSRARGWNGGRSTHRIVCIIASISKAYYTRHKS